MAAPENWDQFNEDMRRWQELAEEMALKYQGLVNVADSRTLGALAFIANLSSAPMGDLATMQQRLQVQNVAGRSVAGSGPELLAKGAWGVGSSGGFVNNGNGVPSSFFTTADGTNFPSTFGVGICSRRNSSQAFEIFTSTISSGGQSAYWRKQTANGWSANHQFYDTQNTTRDSNGNLRAASPIFRVANSAECAAGDGFEDAGCGTANDQASGVISERIETGVYVISGSLGLDKNDSWPSGFTVPQDANGNNLIHAELEESDDGTLTLRTYDPAFDWRTGRHIPGEPMNIVDGRFVAMRLKMPSWPHRRRVSGFFVPKI